MSLAYVQKRGLNIKTITSLGSIIQFAGGIISKLLGQVNVDIKIGTEQSFQYGMSFYVLDGLTCDILPGENP